ncbi:MAG: glycosyltransferase family 9 protein [Bacteriovoracaceae bacterium]
MKILIRLPNWLGDIMMSFPFLHAIQNVYPEAELMIIIKPQYRELMELLPFKVRVIEYDKKRDGGLPHHIHKFSVNQKLIFNIDLFFCLPPSFSSAFMGQSFRAKARVGYTGEWRSFLLTHKKAKPVGVHRSEEYLELIDLFKGETVTRPEKILSRPFAPYFEGEEQSYVVINVNSEASSRRLPVKKWTELLELFQRQKFVFIGMEKDQERVAEVIATLPEGRNEYVNLAGKTSILELAQLLSHSKGLITNDSGPAHLASYVGASVVVFFGAGDPKNTAPTYARGNTLIFNELVSCSPCLKNECPIKTLDCLNRISMDKVLDQAYSFLHLS